MVLDPNWGTNLFRTYLSGRESRRQEREDQEQSEMRGLQRQQIQGGMARQAKQDAANDSIAGYYRRQIAPPAPVAPAAPPSPVALAAAPVAPMRPTKTPPDALAGGGIPGVKVQESLKGRPGIREVAKPAIDDAMVKKAAKDPEFYNKMVAAAPLMDPELKAKFVEAGLISDVARVEVQERERAAGAPLAAYKLEQEDRDRDFKELTGRHSMQNSDAQVANQKMHYANVEANKKRDYDRQIANDRYEQSGAKYWQQEAPKAVTGAISGIMKPILDTAEYAGKGIVDRALGNSKGQIAAGKYANMKDLQTQRDVARAAYGTARGVEAMERSKLARRTALETAEGRAKSNELIATANNKRAIAIANLGQAGMNQRLMEKIEARVIQEMYSEGDTSAESVATAVGLAFDDNWIGKDEVSRGPGRNLQPPVADTNIGNVRPTDETATRDDIARERERRAAARAAAAAARGGR